VAKDEAEAVAWYRKSAEQGNPNAQNNLGACYEGGLGVAQDFLQAVSWYRKAAEQGFADGQTNLGACYASGKGVAKDFPQAVSWYRKAAEQGDAQGQFNLGTCYENGTGVDKDMAVAVSWYAKSAQQGYAKAQINMGICCYSGEGVKKDVINSFIWFSLAAVNDEDARHNLAVLKREMTSGQIEVGEQAAMRVRSAFEARRTATTLSAKKVNADAQVSVFEGYKTRAEKGDRVAQFNMGCCYSKGDGVVQDQMQAVLWYRKSAEQGFADAQFNLGNCYANGRGVAKDEIEAYAYYNLAGITDEDARKNLILLENKMSRDEIAAGQKRTKDLQKEIEEKKAGK
jgi:TPR repeat protein